MTRVIAGSAGGRRLAVPAGRLTRPTADRVKEALFSSLGPMGGLVVLDLYAGGGGLGIEALSRGAASAVFVEQDARAAGVLRTNLRTATVEGRATVVCTPVAAYRQRPRGGPFDLVLCDPPYAVTLDAVAADLEGLITTQTLTPGARVVVERDRRRDEPIPDPLTHDPLIHDRDRAYGDTLLRYFVHRPDQADLLEASPS